MTVVHRPGHHDSRPNEKANGDEDPSLGATTCARQDALHPPVPQSEQMCVRRALGPYAHVLNQRNSWW